jgi:hypothetical protein
MRICPRTVSGVDQSPRDRLLLVLAEQSERLRLGQIELLGTAAGTAEIKQQQWFAAVCPAVPLSRAPRASAAD